MRFATVIASVAFLALSAVATPAGAQDGDDRGPTSPPYYINKDARFAMLFPGTVTPAVTDVPYTGVGGAQFPAKRYSVTQGENQYNVTVVDYSAGPAMDLAVIQQAVDTIIRKGMLVYQSQAPYEPGVGSRQLIVALPGGRQIQASVYMWNHRLFITEGTGMAGSPPLLRFSQSIVLFEANGDEVQGDVAPEAPGGGGARAGRGGGGGRGGN